jgi:hypothetical protein
MASYNYLGQSYLIIPKPGVSSCLAFPRDNDAFFNPTTTGHSGYAFDGQLYAEGVLVSPSQQASWFTESSGPFRGPSGAFPQSALILFSTNSLTIYDETQQNLPLWMQFVLADNYLLTNNFNGISSFTASEVSYAQGVISALSLPDPGMSLQTNLVVNIDFTQDTASIEFLTGPGAPPNW